MNYYKGLKVIYPVDELNTHYLDKIISTISKVLEDNRRIYALRIDLRLPVSNTQLDCLRRDELLNDNFCQKDIIKRFVESLKAKIKAQDNEIRRKGGRLYPSRLRYIWCRERNKSLNDHYHMVLFFNKDRYWRCGVYDNERSLKKLIIDAWSSALGEHVEDVGRLVHIPEKGECYFDQNKYDFEKKYSKLFFRLSYFAKKSTKHYGEGKRSFGTSQG